MLFNSNEIVSALLYVQTRNSKTGGYAPSFPYLPSINISYSFQHSSNRSSFYSWNDSDRYAPAYNETEPIEDCDEGYAMAGVNPTVFRVIIYVMYISILLLALVGNGTVCFIVQSSPRMRTVTNYFIANLALGDILMSFFCVPFSFISMFILQYWPFGAILCRVVNYSQAVSVFVSAYTLVAISVDR